MHPRKLIPVLMYWGGVVISSILATPSGTDVTITWLTDRASDTMVEYWPSTYATYALALAAGQTLSQGDLFDRTLSHTVTLFALSGKSYYYRVSSRRDGVVTYSATQSFAFAPILSAASTGIPTSDGFPVAVTSDEGNGTLYWAIVTNGGSCTDAQLKAGSGGNIVAGKAGNQAVSASGAQTVAAITGLSAGTTYQIVFLQTPSAGPDSSQVSASGTVLGATAASFRSASSTFTTNWALGVDPGKPAGAANSDVLIMLFTAFALPGNTLTPPTGWTLIRRDDNVNCAQISYWALGNVASTSFSGGAPVEADVTCIAVQSGNNTYPISAHNGQVGSAASITAPTVTANTGDLSICLWGTNDTVAAFGAIPGGYTERSSVLSTNNERHATGTLGVSAGATGDQTRTKTNNFQNNGSQQIAVRKA